MIVHSYRICTTEPTFSVFWTLEILKICMFLRTRIKWYRHWASAWKLIHVVYKNAQTRKDWKTYTPFEKQSKFPRYYMKFRENEILHEIFRIVSRFPRKISCFIAENQFPSGQCSGFAARWLRPTLYTF